MLAWTDKSFVIKKNTSICCVWCSLTLLSACRKCPRSSASFSCNCPRIFDMGICGKGPASKSRSCLNTLSLEFTMQALTAMHDASPVGQVFGLPCEMNVQNKASHQKIKVPSGGPRIWRPSPGSETQINEQWKGCRIMLTQHASKMPG